MKKFYLVIFLFLFLLLCTNFVFAKNINEGVSMPLSLKVLDDDYSICRLKNTDIVPKWADNSKFSSITRTKNELSIVCIQGAVPPDIKCEKDWKVIKIDSVLEFSMVGIISKISDLLAKNDVSIFVISTFDTDYVLVKSNNLSKTITVLSNAGYKIK